MKKRKKEEEEGSVEVSAVAVNNCLSLVFTYAALFSARSGCCSFGVAVLRARE